MTSFLLVFYWPHNAVFSYLYNQLLTNAFTTFSEVIDTQADFFDGSDDGAAGPLIQGCQAEFSGKYIYVNI